MYCGDTYNWTAIIGFGLALWIYDNNNVLAMNFNNTADFNEHIYAQ